MELLKLVRPLSVAVAAQPRLHEQKWNFLAFAGMEEFRCSSGLRNDWFYVQESAAISCFPLLRPPFQAGSPCGLMRWLPAAPDSASGWFQPSLQHFSWVCLACQVHP